MPCFLVLIALLLPRGALLLLGLFTTYLVPRAFPSLILPVIGFIFAPYTTLAYAVAKNEHGSIDGIWLVLVIVAALADLGALGGAHRTRRVVVVKRAP
jgi:hypothetical protein